MPSHRVQMRGYTVVKARRPKRGMVRRAQSRARMPLFPTTSYNKKRGHRSVFLPVLHSTCNVDRIKRRKGTLESNITKRLNSTSKYPYKVSQLPIDTYMYFSVIYMNPYHKIVNNKIA